MEGFSAAVVAGAILAGVAVASVAVASVAVAAVAVAAVAVGFVAVFAAVTVFAVGRFFASRRPASCVDQRGNGKALPLFLFCSSLESIVGRASLAEFCFIETFCDSPP